MHRLIIEILLIDHISFIVEICKILLKAMSAILKTDVFTYATPTTDLFKIRLQDPSADPDTYIEPNVSEAEILKLPKKHETFN